MIATAAAAIIALAMAGGILLAVGHLRERPLPRGLGVAHGGVAAMGVMLLAVAVFRIPHPLPVNTALLLLVLALIGGLFMLVFRLQRDPPPGFMIVLHGAMALVGLVVLCVGLVCGA